MNLQSPSVSALAKVIKPEGLMWGQPEITPLLDEEQRTHLSASEIHDWLSALYWSEGIAAQYALKMESLAEPKLKTAWKRVYSDELDHQLRIGRWLLEHGVTPLPPNSAVKFASDAVGSIRPEMDTSDLIKSMEASQLFFEEYTRRLLKWRMPFIADRDLRGTLFKIQKDETFHISLGCAQAKAMTDTSPDLDLILRSHSNLLFPFMIGKDLLKASQFKQVRQGVDKVVERIFFGPNSDTWEGPPPSVAKFLSIPGYACVACCPWHESGIHLEPRLEEATGDVVDTLSFPKRTQGFNHIVHGGFVSMALDEMLGYSVITGRELLPLTKSLEISFLAPVKTDIEYTIRSRVLSSDRQIFQCEGEIVETSSGRTKAKAKGIFFVPDVALASSLFPQLALEGRVSSMLYKDNHASITH